MKNEKRKIYYSDPLNDEFSTTKIETKKIDGDYVYIHKSLFKKSTKFFWYRMMATPIAFIYLKLKFCHKIINKNLLKNAKKEGYFIYGNHTQAIADAFIPTMLCYPKPVYTIVHPNNVSMPYLGKITPSLGAVPLPDEFSAVVNFIKAIETRVNGGNAVCIYPEAHIWPYYTKIREFSDKSFKYPVKFNKPVYCFTNTYQKKKNSKRIKIVTYVDGPFITNDKVSVKEQKQILRDSVYETMVNRSKMNEVEIVKYIRSEKL